MGKVIGYLLLVIAVVSMSVLSSCSSETNDNSNPPLVTPGITEIEKEAIKYIYELERLARDVY
jgi:hypothetical protein